jgi:hypothetical protein
MVIFSVPVSPIKRECIKAVIVVAIIMLAVQVFTTDLKDHIQPPTIDPGPNSTMTVKGAYTAVNHKVTVVNGPFFTRLASTVLRPFVDVSYTIKNGEKRAENRIFDRLRHDEIRP